MRSAISGGYQVSKMKTLRTMYTRSTHTPGKKTIGV